MPIIENRFERLFFKNVLRLKSFPFQVSSILHNYLDYIAGSLLDSYRVSHSSRIKSVLTGFHVPHKDMISDIYLQIRLWSESDPMPLSFSTNPDSFQKPQNPASLCEKRGLNTHSISLPGLGVEGPSAGNAIHMLQILFNIIILDYLQYWFFTDKLRI